MEHEPGRMPPNELAQDAVDAVRSALERYMSHPAESATDLRVALHELAREARLAAIPPERLLVILKRAWRSLPHMLNAGDQTEQTRVLQEVVAMCIREYFAD